MTEIRTGSTMSYLRWTSLALIFFLPMLCRAESICPWLNQATASGVLGGAASSSVETGSTGQAVCAFHFQKGDTAYDLRIRVERMKDYSKEFDLYQKTCGSQKLPLAAIGNEATLCEIEGRKKKSAQGEQVVGRVRDRAFIVSVSTSGTNDRSMTRDVLKQKASGVAEQVAGALF